MTKQQDTVESLLAEFAPDYAGVTGGDWFWENPPEYSDGMQKENVLFSSNGKKVLDPFDGSFYLAGIDVSSPDMKVIKDANANALKAALSDELLRAAQKVENAVSTEEELHRKLGQPFFMDGLEELREAIEKANRIKAVLGR